jgi:sugar O-acyltransferase (sialic acid O-acetyltransferase NeuD family)
MLVIGAKGHAKEILPIIEQLQIDSAVYFFDNVSSEGENLLFNTFTIIKNIEQAKEILSVDNRVVLGVGNPIIRYKLGKQFKQMGAILTSIISPNAQISPYDVELEAGLNIMYAVMISSSVSIGEGSLINAFASVHHDVKVGCYNEIAPGVRLLGNCQTGNFCRMGASSVILPHIKIGQNVIIGAGAVVTKDVEDNSVVVGVPARVIKRLPQPNWI